jgi:hypothetical protein
MEQPWGGVQPPSEWKFALRNPTQAYLRFRPRTGFALGMPVIIKSTLETITEGFPDMLTPFFAPESGVA